jgi:hypothetical protein
MYDMPVSTETVPKGSKLNLYAVLSEEVRKLVREKFLCEIHTIVTTAFSRKPASMKYRGLFDVLSRKETSTGYSINYVSQAGQWSLKDGLIRWYDKHGS